MITEQEIKVLVKSFESSFEGLKDAFQKDNCFFTETELHAYFYHLCLRNTNLWGLVHTEYPTPFKCIPSFNDEESKASKHRRAHIDLVLLNPNFVDYAKQENPQIACQIITGIGSGSFSTYINGFDDCYKDFFETHGQSVLLYALEFKYYRHSSDGGSAAKQAVEQDINKLKLLKEHKLGTSIPFCQNIKSLVFISKNANSNVDKNVGKIQDPICEIVYELISLCMPKQVAISSKKPKHDGKKSEVGRKEIKDLK
jgi:hypothetical protein